MSSTPRTSTDVASVPAEKIEQTGTHTVRRFATLIVTLIAAAVMALSMVTAQQASASTPNEAAVFNLLNWQRTHSGLPRLVMSPALQNAARSHNGQMSRYNTMSHQLRGERDLGARLDAAGFRWTRAAENVGWTSAFDVNALLNIQRVMYNEPAPNNGHRLNIICRYYRYVGVAVLVDKTHHKLWLTTDFGSL